MKSYAEQITDLIAARPGIRNAEIADELDLWPADVRPLIQARIENSRIIVDSMVGLVNAYRINPKWKPSDASFKPLRRAPEDDGTEASISIKKKPGRPPGSAPGKKPKRAPATGAAKPAPNKGLREKTSEKQDVSAPPATPGPLAFPVAPSIASKPTSNSSQVLGDNQPKIGLVVDEHERSFASTLSALPKTRESADRSPQIENTPATGFDLAAGSDRAAFACAVYDDGALRIEHADGVVQLTPEQTARTVAHLSRFYPEIKP